MALDVKIIGERITHLRELRGESLGQLAESADLAKSYLAKIENGEVDNPGLKTLGAICRALGTTLPQLLQAEKRKGSGSKEAPERYSKLAEELRLASIDLPDGLRAFAKKMERAGTPVSPQVLSALALVQFRGRRPQTLEDWEFLFQAFTRSAQRR
jgi:transcriptional regulator with XRE-family HTH domain